MKTKDLYKKNEECCGCSMCANVCPAKIIHMQPDKTGFMYPVIENEESCLHCRKCQKVCPLKNTREKDSKFIDFYAASYKNDTDTISCSSGGLATAISSLIIKQGGIVYGAAYTDDYKKVIYERADSEEKLEKLKGSKYAQAEKGNIYKLISRDLNKGVKCLFIGLPCDVAAVVEYFKQNRNLYTIELVCHGPTSNDVQKQYCEEIEKKYSSKIIFFTNRYKKNGEWKPFYNFVQLENGKIFFEQFHKSSFGTAFRYLKRPSCYVCSVKDKALMGDLMIGDYHYVEDGMVGYNIHGVSSALIHNNKGNELISLLEKNMNIVSIPERNALANGAIHHPIAAPKGYAKYKQIYLRQGLSKAHSMWIVVLSNYKRFCKAVFLKIAVKIKRKLWPISRPK